MRIILGLVLVASTAMVNSASMCSINQDPHFLQLYNDHVLGEMARLVNNHQMFSEDLSPSPNSRRISNIELTQCGSLSDPVHLKALDIVPNPIVYPGDMLVSFMASAIEEINYPISVNTTLTKGVGPTYIQLPCEKNIGTCHYPDYCANIERGLTHCPQAFRDGNTPCKCPYSLNDYTVNDALIRLQDLDLPDYLTSSHYRLTVRAYSSIKQLTCFNIDFNLKIHR